MTSRWLPGLACTTAIPVQCGARDRFLYGALGLWLINDAKASLGVDGSAKN
jgi:hypothetical protein